MVGISLSGVSLLVNNFIRKPDDEVEDRIHEAAEQIFKTYEFIDTLVRVAKTGSSYTIEIDFLLPKSLSDMKVDDLNFMLRRYGFEKNLIAIINQENELVKIEIRPTEKFRFNEKQDFCHVVFSENSLLC